MKYLLIVFLGLFTLSLSGCYGARISEVPLAEAQIPPPDAQPSPIAFNKIRFAVPTGNRTLSKSPRGPLGLLYCYPPYGMVNTGLSSRSFPRDNYRTVFGESLGMLGYDIAGDPGRMFDETEDLQRAYFSIGARIVDIQIDVCNRANFLGVRTGESGEAEITIEWTAFDLLNRRIAYQETHKGWARNKLPNTDAINLLLEQAFKASAHNLGADKEFYNLIFKGQIPLSAEKAYIDPNDEIIGLQDSLDPVELKSLPLNLTPATERLDDIRKNAVLIQGIGHGSGFFVTKEGHIITNAHVIGNADRARVVLSGKEEQFIADVLRVDRRRDVALLKLEKIPRGFTPTLLPVRTELPRVGEDIYAIGAPLVTSLQDTVTKGIVSTIRFDKREKQYYIQGDVYITGGNSGGPLIDDKGNIIGLTVSSWVSGGEERAGLNNFIPIGDALDKLDIELLE